MEMTEVGVFRDVAVLTRRNDWGLFIFLYTPVYFKPDRDCRINERQLCTPYLPPKLLRAPKYPGELRPWVMHLRYNFQCDACPLEKSVAEDTRVRVCRCTDAAPRSEIGHRYRWYSSNEVLATLRQIDTATARALSHVLQRLVDPSAAIAS